MRSAPPAWALALVLALAGLRAGQGAKFQVEKGSLRVKQPPAVAGTFDAAAGDFGSPLYGGTLVGEVVYVSSNELGCSDFPSLPKHGDLPVVVLVKRGSCFFVEKAFNAQRAGAAAVIVYDHTQEPLLTMAVPETDQRVQELVPQIHIPTVLVQKDVGEKLRAELTSSGTTEVVAELDWKESVTHPDARVEWQLWFSANQGTRGSAASFLQDFHDTAINLERPGYTQFTPHIMLRGCSRYAPSEQCSANCIRRGRYCSINAVPSQWSNKYSGAKVVEEGLRSLCVHRRLNDTGQAWRWWDYTSRFLATCTMHSSRFDRPCAEAQMRAAGMDQADVGAVDSCVGRLDEDRSLDLLEGEMRQQREQGILLLPTLIINVDQYRGRLDTPDVLRAVCAGFSEGTEPAVCLSGGLNVDECAAGTDNCWREGREGGASACVDTFRGFICRCPAGWTGDGHECADIDECALGIAGCDQLCINTPGSYKCDCKSGFTLHGGIGAPGICLPSDYGGGGRMPGWLIALLALASVACVTGVGVGLYRYKLRRDMQSEMRALLREYMPLAQADPELRHSLLDKEGMTGTGGARGSWARGQDEGDVEGGRQGGGPFSPPRTPGRGFSPPSITELAERTGPRS